MSEQIDSSSSVALDRVAAKYGVGKSSRAKPVPRPPGELQYLLFPEIANASLVARLPPVQISSANCSSKPRLRYLRDRWARPLAAHKRIRMLTDINAEPGTGFAAFEVDGMEPEELSCVQPKPNVSYDGSPIACLPLSSTEPVLSPLIVSWSLSPRHGRSLRWSLPYPQEDLWRLKLVSVTSRSVWYHKLKCITATSDPLPYKRRHRNRELRIRDVGTISRTG